MSAAMTVRAYGDRALLVELDDTAAAVDWARGLAERPPQAAGTAVGEVVPAARTVLVVAADGASLEDLRAVVDAVVPLAGGTVDAEIVEIPVVYDGEDLDAVGELTGLGREGVIEAHTGQEWQVAFGGFAPGFGYLSAEDDRLHVPRREQSRTAVPPGSVGLAGEFSGVYPTESPGGWQLIGRTAEVMFDLDREPAALLRPGVRVRFREVAP